MLQSVGLASVHVVWETVWEAVNCCRGDEHVRHWVASPYPCISWCYRLRIHVLLDTTVFVSTYFLMLPSPHPCTSWYCPCSCGNDCAVKCGLQSSQLFQVPRFWEALLFGSKITSTIQRIKWPNEMLKDGIEWTKILVESQKPAGHGRREEEEE